MSAALSIDFGNSYTKVGIRSGQNEMSRPLRSQADLKEDEDNLCIPTVAARIVKNGKERWAFGTDVVRLGSKGSAIQVLRNWKPRFFRGQETSLDDERTDMKSANKASSVWDEFTDAQIKMLLSDGTLVAKKRKEALTVLSERTEATKPSDEDFDYKEVGKGYFAWLRGFVEPICKLHGIDTNRDVPVRITLPSFGAKSAEATLTLRSILQETGWKLAEKDAALPEPVANLIGTFSGGRNFVWQPQKRPGGPLTYSLTAMIGESALFKAIHSFAVGSRSSRPPIYWVMVADMGGYTTDFAVVGFDLDNVEIQANGFHDGKRLLGDHSEPIGVHDLDKRVREVLSDENRKAFDSLTTEVDGRRFNGFHRAIYQTFRPYDTGQGFIGQAGAEKKKIEEVIRQFADQVAEYAELFLLIEQYDHIDELILTGGGCNIPFVREAIRKKLERYRLKNSHIPVADPKDLPPRSQQLDRLLVRGATALGATSVYFDYD